MNPVFWLLVVIIAVILWLLLAFIYYPLGKFVWRIWSDTSDELKREDKNDEREKD